MSTNDLLPSSEGEHIKAVVKWFNLSKGFGFVAPADNSPDAFLHVSVLTRAGLQQIAEGTKLLVDIGDGPKGRQIRSIISVLGQAEAPTISTDRPTPSGPTEKMQGTVKWFRPEKGFGFISPDDEGKDIFVHKTVVGRLGLESLETGQRVSMNVHVADKGREAVDVQLIEGSVQEVEEEEISDNSSKPIMSLSDDQPETDDQPELAHPTDQPEIVQA